MPVGAVPSPRPRKAAWWQRGAPCGSAPACLSSAWPRSSPSGRSASVPARSPRPTPPPARSRPRPPAPPRRPALSPSRRRARRPRPPPSPSPRRHRPRRPCPPRQPVETVVAPSTTTTSTTLSRKERIRLRYVRAMRVAIRQRDDRYVAGGTGPNAFDCSGLVRFAYRRAEISYRLGGGHSARAMLEWARNHDKTRRHNPQARRRRDLGQRVPRRDLDRQRPRDQRAQPAPGHPDHRAPRARRPVHGVHPDPALGRDAQVRRSMTAGHPGPGARVVPRATPTGPDDPRRPVAWPRHPCFRRPHAPVRDPVLADRHGRRPRPRGDRHPGSGGVHRPGGRAGPALPRHDQQLDLHAPRPRGAAADERPRRPRGPHLDLGAGHRAVPAQAAARRLGVRDRRGGTDDRPPRRRLHPDRAQRRTTSCSARPGRTASSG